MTSTKYLWYLILTDQQNGQLLTLVCTHSLFRTAPVAAFPAHRVSAVRPFLLNVLVSLSARVAWGTLKALPSSA